MKTCNYIFLILCLALVISCNSDEEPTATEGYDGFTLEWSDEFNTGINLANWNYELGDGTDYGLAPGWGNNEKQLYTDSQDNALIKSDDDGNSVLAIIARKTSDDSYTSAKLTTQQLQSFRFGRIEARIKVPVGQGMWPAFWLLGDNFSFLDWPGCGEIDIMEVIGNQPGVVHCSAHWTNGETRLQSDSEGLNTGDNLGDDYYVYRVDWTPESMDFSIDGQLVNTVAIEDDMKEFLRPFYIIFNVAVGGNWPGDPDASTVFPKEMLVDWVRVYSQDGLNKPAEPALDIDEETIGVLSNDIAQHAFNSQLNQFPGISLKSFGDGGEPYITSSDMTTEGDSSLMLTYPGEGWGGAFFELETPIDMTGFSNGDLVFSINKAAEFDNIEIKLESVATQVSLFIKDYSGVDLGNGFFEYRIPLADFSGLDLSDFRIPFALWNPVDAMGEYVEGVIIIDNIYLE
ncbi:MAG: family 16 glycosylhydrolase [Saprospiraceae bacterium]|nr:family 16 glycosylhydrolase [Saprospiraceae bacterium]